MFNKYLMQTLIGLAICGVVAFIVYKVNMGDSEALKSIATDITYMGGSAFGAHKLAKKQEEEANSE